MKLVLVLLLLVSLCAAAQEVQSVETQRELKTFKPKKGKRIMIVNEQFYSNQFLNVKEALSFQRCISNYGGFALNNVNLGLLPCFLDVAEPGAIEFVKETAYDNQIFHYKDGQIYFFNFGSIYCLNATVSKDSYTVSFDYHDYHLEMPCSSVKWVIRDDGTIRLKKDKKMCLTAESNEPNEENDGEDPLKLEPCDDALYKSGEQRFKVLTFFTNE